MRATFRATRRSCFTSISKAGDITVLRPFCTHASIMRDAGVQRNPFLSLFARLVRARGVSCQILKIPLNIPSHHRLFARFRARTQRVIRESDARSRIACSTCLAIHSTSSTNPRKQHVATPLTLVLQLYSTHPHLCPFSIVEPGSSSGTYASPRAPICRHTAGLSRAGGNEEMGGYSMKSRGCVHLSLGSLWMGCLGVSIGIKSEALEMVVGGDVWGRGIGGCWVDARPRLVMCTLGCVFVASASC
ncbi:hypothetical protein HBI17_146510 [Parastagonospora nodorum]|nr:hypothetical protein HBH47_056880 [Parastagonospora nodorum]KAH4980114.1 hypothetical protein HBI76_184430 [Parastagonospora nodorum]KAH5408643.1 hypothetical protein HBI32_145220 [Parastagonospora nodorum]KAH5513561.1 hypothetical protein HBI31_017680 [Parastagonospora nodorum]KAH5745633.1 hypothetical protein HBI17_146510 [Parastagonospora nodorum]